MQLGTHARGSVPSAVAAGRATQPRADPPGQRGIGAPLPCRLRARQPQVPTPLVTRTFLLAGHLCSAGCCQPPTSTSRPQPPAWDGGGSRGLRRGQWPLPSCPHLPPAALSTSWVQDALTHTQACGRHQPLLPPQCPEARPAPGQRSDLQQRPGGGLGTRTVRPPAARPVPARRQRRADDLRPPCAGAGRVLSAAAEGEAHSGAPWPRGRPAEARGHGQGRNRVVPPGLAGGTQRLRGCRQAA